MSRPRRGGRSGDGAWDEYVYGFHRERPGITESVLHRASYEGRDPYEWCAEATGHHRGSVLDVACGSGPLGDHLTPWVGIDRSRDELLAARAAGRKPLVASSASHLPFPGARFEVTVVAMALQVLHPLDGAVSELARVTRPGGRLVVLLPGRRPLPWRDAVLYSRLRLRLGRPIGYPNDARLDGAELGRLMAEYGFEVVSDEGRCFALGLATVDDADELVRSLYLPAVATSRVNRAASLVRRRVGGHVSIPLRRVVLERSGGGV